jgi:hypothetical protein
MYGCAMLQCKKIIRLQQKTSTRVLLLRVTPNIDLHPPQLHPPLRIQLIQVKLMISTNYFLLKLFRGLELQYDIRYDCFLMNAIIEIISPLPTLPSRR